MSTPPHTDQLPGRPGKRFDPHVRLVRSLLPRTACVALFGPGGELIWSTETATGPDLVNLVDEALAHTRAEPASPGQVRLLEGDSPVYLCPLRSDRRRLLAILAVECRAHEGRDKKTPDFAFAHALLAPVLECLRRELVTHATIEELTRTIGGLDNLLLDEGAAPGAGTPADADELQQLLQQTIEHLAAATGALLVPERNLTLVRAGGTAPPDMPFLMRAHRRLLLEAQQHSGPVISNETRSATAPQALPYRLLSCPLRSRAGRFVGVLALLREARAAAFNERDAHLAEILARKAIGVIESSHDSLTGLLTRGAFERRARAVAALQEPAQSWSALYIDVDQLHVINEESGMHVGDTVLGRLGELLRERLPPGACAARISGDRFAVLLPAAVHDAQAFAEALCEGAAQLTITHAEAQLPVSISVGVAALDRSSSEPAHLLAPAETACKAAKDRGRNRVEVYQQCDVSIVRRHADIGMAGQLREAIANGRLHLDAQPIRPFARPGAPTHYELLLRMTDTNGRTVGPDSFISAATRYQLMPLIDRWVIKNAIDALKPHAAALKGRLGFAVNFSGQSLDDAGFADQLIERVAGSGLDPALLCFELTENAGVAHLGRAAALMRRLRELGCGVALDDFGAGLSSLSALRQLPVSMLKIDGSFVREVLTDARAESMVRAIVQLARGLSILTVAEYVETEAIAARVAELGVDYGQGFALGRPRPLAELLLEIPVTAARAPRSDDHEYPDEVAG